MWPFHPLVGGHQQPLKGLRFHHPKKVAKNCRACEHTYNQWRTLEFPGKKLIFDAFLTWTPSCWNTCREFRGVMKKKHTKPPQKFTLIGIMKALLVSGLSTKEGCCEHWCKKNSLNTGFGYKKWSLQQGFLHHNTKTTNAAKKSGGSTYFLCSPRSLGKMNPILTCAYFSNGLVQPPTSDFSLSHVTSPWLTMPPSSKTEPFFGDSPQFGNKRHEMCTPWLSCVARRAPKK